MKLTYEIPQGFSDEIKWLKFFHTRSIKMLAITVTPGIVIARFLHSFRVLLVFIAIWALLVIILTGIYDDKNACVPVAERRRAVF